MAGEWVMKERELERCIARLAHEISERSGDPSGYVLVGVVTGGERLADPGCERSPISLLDHSLDVRSRRDVRPADVHARLGHLLNVVHLHAPVDLQTAVQSVVVDELPRRPGLVEGGGDEGLSAESRVHAHEEDDVELVHHVLFQMVR